MTIAEAAAKYGVSKQAIYQRIKSSGLRLENLRNKSTGQITAEGELMLEKLFGENKEQFKTVRFDLKEEYDKALKNIEDLKIQIEKQDLRIKSLEDALAEARNTLSTERELFKRFLPAPAEQPGKKSGLFKRIASAIKGE